MLLATLSITLPIGFGCGCATSSAPSAAAPAEQALTAEQRLHRLAVQEVGRAPEAVDVPVPPGVEEAALTAAKNRPAATLPLSVVLPNLASDVQIPAPGDEPPELSSEQRDEALKHYLAGRDAMLADRHLVAVTELEQALAIDPSSAAILRALAQSYAALDNASKMAGAYEQLLSYHGDDQEALLRLALLAANRRDFETAAALLARRRLAHANDDAEDLLADYTLHVALQQLGYDFAAVEAAAPVLETEFPFEPDAGAPQRLASIYRQRAEVQRSVGDAYCRLGRYEDALHAYTAATELPVADPGALQARIIYANLRQGRDYAAQEALLSTLKGAAPDLSDREIRLCEYIAAQTADHAALAEAVVELFGSHPDEPDLARASALLLPAADAQMLLQSFVSRRPRDVEVVGQLLSWLGARDEEAALALAAALTADHPDLAEAYVQRLVLAVPRPAELVDDQRVPERAEYAEIRARVLAQLWALGDAWFECLGALERWPEDVGLRLLLIDLAGRLDEPQLLQDAMERAIDLDDAWSWIVRARAWRSAEAFPEAIAAAQSALERAGEQQQYRAQALLELARTYALRAEPMPIGEQRNAEIQRAAEVAEEARSVDPTMEEAYELLLGLYSGNSQLFGRNKARSLLAEISEADENDRFYGWLSAQRAIQEGRYEQGLEYCLNLYEGDPTNVRALALAMVAWERLGRASEAERWLRDKLEMRPGDPGILDQLVRLLLRTEQISEARSLLSTRLEADPDDPAALHLLEFVFTAGGDFAEAVKLGEQRFAQRPEGSRRALQAAALYVRAGMSARAIDQLEWIGSHADQASYRHMVMAVALSSQIPRTSDRGNQLTVDLVEQIVHRYPSVPLSVYGTALRALTRLGDSGERFEALAHRAATRARESQDTSIAGVDAWCTVAQALVDDGDPAAAGRVLRARMAAPPDLDPPALGLLASAILAADAAAGKVSASIDLLLELEARSALDHLRSVEPVRSLPDALLWASQVYAIAGDEAGTEKLLQEAVRHDPNNALAMNNLGYMRIESGHDDAQTAELIERAHELEPDDVDILDSLAWLRYKQGRFAETAHADQPAPHEGGPDAEPPAMDEPDRPVAAGADDDAGPGAVALLERIVKIDDEPSAAVLDHYGDALWRIGHADQALRQWRRAAELLSDPDRRENLLRNYLLLQSQHWRLVIQDPRALYDRDFTEVLQRVQSKILQAEQGGAPPVASTFREQQAAGVLQRSAEEAVGVP